MDAPAAARLGVRLQYLTIAWNAAECVVAVVAGLGAGSIALVGFGVDSAIEVAASLAALWRLRREPDPVRRDRAERQALRVVGITFLALGAYVSYEAVAVLLAGEGPERSLTGLVLAALSLAVMPLLAWQKRRVARALGSGALEAETRQTEVCAWLSGLLFAGLGLQAGLGWWWADPVAALGMVPFIVREGWEAIRGRTCCA